VLDIAKLIAFAHPVNPALF